MPKDDFVYIRHMLDCACEALEMAKGVDREAFDASRATALAITHLLQTIGEAARNLSPEFRASNTHIPWALIVSMRHRIVHDYLHVDFDVVWSTLRSDLPRLRDGLIELLDETTGAEPR